MGMPCRKYSVTIGQLNVHHACIKMDVPRQAGDCSEIMVVAACAAAFAAAFAAAAASHR
jgi:hypothetical protein